MNTLSRKPRLLRIVPLLAILTSEPVGAQMDWVPDAGNPVDEPFTINNVPSVLYDEEHEVFRAWYTPESQNDILYAESKDGADWEPGLAPVLSAGWEVPWSCWLWSPSVMHDPENPSVVEDDNTGERYAYQMWYAGGCPGQGSQIGYAVSHDGKSWASPLPDPVLTMGEPGDWDSAWLHIPSVHYDPNADLYRMWYSGGDGSAPHNIGLATSKDGMNWKKHPGPLQLRRPGERNVINSDVLYNGTHYELWFSLGGGPDRWDIHYARSLDGITWTRPPNSKVNIPFEGAWSDLGTCNPDVYFDGVSSYTVWYTGDCRGNADEGAWRTGMAIFEAELPRPHFRVVTQEPGDALLERQPITFDAAISNSPLVPNPQPGEFSYSWDFGDGVLGKEVEAEHTFAVAAEYRVRLTFSDGLNSASIERLVRVEPQPLPGFLRGDCNDDGTVDISDAVFSLGSLFLGEGDIRCDDACDSNDDGVVDVSDSITTLSHLFLGDPAVIAAPGTKECGVDPTEDDLGCDSYAECGTQ